MHRIGFLGLTTGVWLATAACGGDTSVMGGGGSSQGGSVSSGTGGSTSSGTGGATSSGTGGSVSSGTGGGTSSGSGGAGGNVSGGACEQACDYLATTCGLPNACDLIPGMDCANADNADCRGQCLLDATCQQIATLPTNSPDPTLQACLQGCQGGGGNCQQCIFQSCGSELQACQQTPGCVAYIQCIQGCQGDPSCIDGCLASNPSPQADALSACSCSSCANQCPFCG